MSTTAGMRCLLVIVMSQVALAVPGKEAISPATGCVIAGDSLHCTGGEWLLGQVRVAAPGTECYDVITGSSVRCGQNGTWTQQAALGLKSSGKLTRPKRLAAAIFSGLSALFAATGAGFVGYGVFSADSPPQIVCPGPLRDVADHLKTCRSFSWSDPQARDDKGITKGPECSPRSGSTFKEGLNYVQCWAADKKGQIASCTFSVTVDVRRCPAMTWPDDGSVSCSHDSLWGSTCTLTCDHGFEAIGSKTSECRGSHWSVPKFRCKPVQCRQQPTVPHGHIMCTAIPVYGSFCQLTCVKGFRLRGTPTVFCKEDGTFTAPGRCEDDESPSFPNGCPSDVEMFAAPVGNLTLVRWITPQVKDNSGSYNLTCSHDVSRDFAPGHHTVVYTATDAANNMASCHFQVLIKTISCGVPSFDKSGMELMTYSCPSGHVLGAQCKVYCKSGYPRLGPDTLFCDRDDSNSAPKGVWSTRDTRKLECRVIPCPPLTLPENGALACDQWGYGEMCSMMCNENYDIPLEGRHKLELFVCGLKTGRWLPTDKVPGCTEKRQPTSMRLPSKLHYYTGNCPDSATQQQIKENFIKILKQSNFPEKCIDVPECRVENVLVKCGPVSARRRKRHVSNVSADFEIEVDFSIAATLPSGQSGTQAAPLLQAVLSDVASVLGQEAATGTFDQRVNGLDLKGEDIALGSPSFACAEGTELTDSLTCAGCSPGTFFNASVNDCQDCPVGSYAEAGSATTCTSCPAHTSTMGTGKSSVNQCLAQCRPGWVSDTGLEPCQQCPVGSLQTEWGHTLCSQCPSNSSTLQPASTSPSQCLAMNGCDAKPCGKHTCASVPGGWQCQCHGGWSGVNCSTPPDLCLQHQCQNGASCVNGLHKYSCLCKRGFKGELCNVVIRNGGWSEWSNWTECSATCGGGSSSRQRSCDSPSPDPDGLPCVGPSVESRSCHPQPCPRCPRLPQQPRGIVWNCTKEEEMTSCTEGCRDGLVLVSPRMSVYQCGRLTNYSWTFVSEDTPDGFVPECTESQIPEEMVLQVTSSVGLDCQEAASRRDEALYTPRKAARALDCVRSGKCRAEVTLSACPTSHLQKRLKSPGSSNVTLTLTFQLTSGPNDSSTNISGSTEDAANAYLAVLTSLNRSQEQLQKARSQFLTVEVGGQLYPPSPVSYSGNVTCPPGTVPAQVACGECPRGTYQSGVQCVLCERGSYTDDTGSTRCTDCPPGLSTPGLGSSSSSQCRPGPGKP